MLILCCHATGVTGDGQTGGFRGRSTSAELDGDRDLEATLKGAKAELGMSMKSWRSKALLYAALTATTFVLVSCATPLLGRRSAASAPTANASTNVSMPSIGPSPTGVQRFSAAHRQYYDQRRKRYYYFDPSRRAYFWEDGSPKT